MVDNGMVDLGVDVASLFLPVPAGSTKVARVSTKPAVKPEIKQNKDFGGGQDGKGRCKPCSPPAGTEFYRYCDGHSPHSHHGIYTPYSHIYIMNQAPYPSCKCFINKTDKCIPGKANCELLP